MCTNTVSVSPLTAALITALFLVAVPGCKKDSEPPKKPAVEAADDDKDETPPKPKAPASKPGYRLLMLTTKGVDVRNFGDASGQLLASGTFKQAALEWSTGLLWVLEGKDLKAVALAKGKGEAVTVVRGMPAATFVIRRKAWTTSVGVAHGKKGIETDTEIHVFLDLTKAGKPKLEARAPAGHAGMPEEMQMQGLQEAEKLLKGAKIDATALATLPGPGGALPEGWKAPSKRTLNKKRIRRLPRWIKRDCRDRSMCGQNTGFGTGGALLITASHECGDACDVSCVLFDPKAKKFAKIDSAPKWQPYKKSVDVSTCGLYAFNPKQDTYFILGYTDTSLCTMGKPCTKTADRALAWVEGGVLVGETQ